MSRVTDLGAPADASAPSSLFTVNRAVVADSTLPLRDYGSKPWLVQGLTPWAHGDP